MEQARVVRISIAPVKALGLVHPDEIEIGPHGVAGNRRFWLLDEDGRLFSNKRCGPMRQIRQEWDEQTRRLTLSFPDGEVVDGVVELGEPVVGDLWGYVNPSRKVIGPWQDALSRFAGRELSLLWADEHAVDRGYRGGAISLVSRGSLERLAEEAGVDEPLDGRRFRMLLEIDGVGAHEEDEWMGTQVQVGEAVLVLNGDVGRCVVTTQDPDTGVSDLDTLGALARYRREGRFEPLPFGLYGSVAVPGRVRVGDAVQPLQHSLLAPT